MSKKRSSGYWKTPIEPDALGDGKRAYYFRNNTLYRYTYASRKETKLIKLPEEDSFYINSIAGNYIL